MPSSASLPSPYDQQLILDRARFPRFGEALPTATHQGKGANLSCGDEVLLQLAVHDDTVLHARHTTRGCAICTASADLVCEWLEGKQFRELAAVDPLQLLATPLSPTRMRCALVAKEAVLDLH